MATNQGNTRLGWTLLLLGTALGLLHWLPFSMDWTILLIIIGAGLFAAGVIQASHRTVFPGAFLALLGTLFYLKHRYIIHERWDTIWPLIITFLGISFLVRFLFSPEKRGELWSGVVLVVLSFILLVTPEIWFDLLYWCGRLWPLGLIILGIMILLKSTRR
ncbi:MAG: DUF5668 domain-containing protein [bacterium]|nr:DUF5668 domain-containing protein [bacterium]